MPVFGAHPPSELELPAGAKKTAAEQPTDAETPLRKGSAVESECQQADQLQYPHLTHRLRPSSFAAVTEEVPSCAVDDEASQLLETSLGTWWDTSWACWPPQILPFWGLSLWTWP